MRNSVHRCEIDLKLCVQLDDKGEVKSLASPAKILVVSPQPDPLIASFAQGFKNLFETQKSTSSKMALFLFQEWEPDICLIDDRLDTVPLLLKMREARGLTVGLIVYSQQPTKAQGTEEQAFRCGADHFCSLRAENGGIETKPLFWRIESLWRRVRRHKSAQIPAAAFAPSASLISTPRPSGETTTRVESTPLKIGELEIFPDHFLVKRRGDRITLAPIQFRLLLHFVNHPEIVLSRPWLKEQVWENASISLRTIDAQISKLKKLIPEVDLCLVNIYGKGYIFTLPAAKTAA